MNCRLLSKRVWLVVAFVGLSGVSTLGAASDHKQLDLKLSFAEQRMDIERKLADGETYAEIQAGDRMSVLDALKRISRNLETANTLEALSENARLEIFNDQSLVNQILTKASDDSRLICTSDVKTGSRRKTTNCLTVAERRRMREASVDAFSNKIKYTPNFNN